MKPRLTIIIELDEPGVTSSKTYFRGDMSPLDHGIMYGAAMHIIRKCAEVHGNEYVGAGTPDKATEFAAGLMATPSGGTLSAKSSMQELPRQ